MKQIFDSFGADITKEYEVELNKQKDLKMIIVTLRRTNLMYDRKLLVMENENKRLRLEIKDLKNKKINKRKKVKYND